MLIVYFYGLDRSSFSRCWRKPEENLKAVLHKCIENIYNKQRSVTQAQQLYLLHDQEA